VSFWGELRRRNVFRVAAAYLVASWLIVQVVGVLTDPLSLPDRIDTVVVVLLAIGFPVALLAAWAYEMTPQGIKRDSEVEFPERESRVTGQRINLIVTILLAGLVGTLLMERYLADSQTASTEGLTRESTIDGPPFRLAVMSMRSLSTSEQDRIFAAGLTSVLIDQLAEVEEFQVTNETSILVYEERPELAETIAEELDVDLLLETTMRVDTERLVVSARLLRGDTWVGLGTFDRRRGDVLALQDDIARSLTDELSLELGVRASATSRAPTTNVAAYDAYLRGRAHISYFRPAAAVDALRQAVEADPQFALAWEALANAYDQLGVMSEPERSEEFRRLRQTAIQTALELDPELIDPDVLRAGQFWSQRDWVDSYRAWAAAIERNAGIRPEGYAGAHLVHVGRVFEGADVYVAMREERDLDARYAGAVGWALDAAGRNEEALAEFERSMDLNGGTPIYAIQHFLALLVAPDASRIERFRAALGPDVVGRLPELVSTWRSSDEAAVILRQLLDDPVESRVVARFGAFSVIAAYHGDVEMALEFLREAYIRSESIFTIYMWHPLMSEVRKTTEFKDVVTEIGLVQYWREIKWADYCRPVSEDDFECF